MKLSERPLLSIIMPTYNRGDVFEQSKKAVLKAIEGMDIEYIIVNDSKTSEIGLDKDELCHIKLLNNPKQGVASARNYGAAHAKSDKLLFIDDDIVIHKNNIEQLLERLHTISLNDTCMNVNWIYPPELQSELNQKPFGRFLIKHGFTNMKGWASFKDWDDNELFEISGLASYCLLISKNNFEKIGRYDEDFPHAGFEDEDFSSRVSQELKILVDPLNTVWHNEVDRIEIKAWMARKERDAITRKIGVLKGRLDYEIEYKGIKKLGYSVLVKLQPMLLYILTYFPNNRFFDSVYFRLVKICLGTSIYKGYTS